MHANPKSVLHLPSAVGGHAWGLAQGEKRLGLETKVLIVEDNWIQYPYDISLEWERRNKVGRVLSSLGAFSKYRKRFDVFHFNFGSTLFNYQKYGIYHWDLPFYPSDKKIIFTYNGCDARQKYATIARTEFSACHEQDCLNGICTSGTVDRRRQRSIRIASKYAHHIFALNPDLLYFLPTNMSSFLPYCIPSWFHLEAPPYRIDKKIRIMHSPTNRAAKGSKYILQALENLKKRHDLEVVLVEGISNEDALKIYRKADLVIDQVLVGWYGGFAVEAMKMGKPVGVFVREEDLKFIPEGMARDLKNAVIQVTPFNIERVLEEYLSNTQKLREKSRAGLEYVHKWHDPLYVAGITKEIYES